ncbi:MAG: MliC family protein, partial [Chloroflexota bacterium]
VLACAAPDRIAASPVHYLCAGGERLSVTYSEDASRLTYRGKTTVLPQAIAASGIRYVGSNLQWWGKGDEGTLSQVEPEQVLARDCRAQPTG